jgi:hypothetical protein
VIVVPVFDLKKKGLLVLNPLILNPSPKKSGTGCGRLAQQKKVAVIDKETVTTTPRYKVLAPWRK